MRLRGRWTDWVAMLAGLALGLSYIWHGMYGLGAGAMFVLGLCTIMASVMSITRPAGLASELSLLGIGVVVFALPLLLGFTGTATAAWTAWILGVVMIGLGAFGLLRAVQTRRRDPELAWPQHSHEVFT